MNMEIKKFKQHFIPFFVAIKLKHVFYFDGLCQTNQKKSVLTDFAPARFFLTTGDLLK